jgi:hypothetical protein
METAQSACLGAFHSLCGRLARPSDAAEVAEVSSAQLHDGLCRLRATLSA